MQFTPTLVYLRQTLLYDINAVSRHIKNVNLNCNADGSQPRRRDPRRAKQGRDFGAVLATLKDEEDIDRVLVETENIFRSSNSLRWSTNHRQRRAFNEAIFRKMEALGIDEGWRSCDDCGVVHHEDDSRHVWGDRTICEVCCDDNYSWSEVMQEYIPGDETVSVYNSVSSFRNGDSDDYALSSCDLDDYEWHDGRGCWVHYDVMATLRDSDEDDDWVEEPIRATSPLTAIGTYHSSRGYVGHIPSEYDREMPRLLLGLELEVEIAEGESRDDAATRVRQALNSDYPYCGTENDGSLRYGFEIVTGYTGLEVHEVQLKKLCVPDVIKGMSSHNTETCGLHVHVDKGDITPLQALRLVDFVSDAKNKPLILAIARRYNTGYCVVKSKEANHAQLVNAWQSHRDCVDNINRIGQIYNNHRSRLSSSVTESRYEAINMQNSNTIEFRLFKGSLKLKSIMACLEFSRALCLFVREYGDAAMNTPEFLLFIEEPRHRRETRYLRNHLAKMGFPVYASPKELDTLLVTKLSKRKQPICVS